MVIMVRTLYLELTEVSPREGVPALVLALPLLLLLLLILHGSAEVGLREAGVQRGQRGGLLEEPGGIAPASSKILHK